MHNTPKFDPSFYSRLENDYLAPNIEWFPDKTSIDNYLHNIDCDLRLPKVYLSLKNSEFGDYKFKEELIEKYYVSLSGERCNIMVYPRDDNPFLVSIIDGRLICDDNEMRNLYLEHLSQNNDNDGIDKMSNEQVISNRENTLRAIKDNFGEEEK